MATSHPIFFSSPKLIVQILVHGDIFIDADIIKAISSIYVYVYMFVKMYKNYNYRKLETSATVTLLQKNIAIPSNEVTNYI